MGILERMREPKAGVVPPRDVVPGTSPSFRVADPGVSSTRRRNWVLFISTGWSKIVRSQVADVWTGTRTTRGDNT